MATTQVHETYVSESKELPAPSTGLLRIAGIMLAIAVIWRLVDQFVLDLGSTWMNILPSKLFPFLIILGFFLKYRPREIGSVLGLSKDNFRAHLAMGLLIGAIISFGIDFGGTIVYGFFIDTSYPLQLHILNQNLLGYMLFFFLTNALLEETLFRGLLINALKTRQTVNRAILISAVMFGVWHAGWPIINGAIGFDAVGQIASMVFFTAILGLFFGIYYERFSASRSLIGPIVVHTIINYVSECFKIGPEPVIQGPDLVFATPGLMTTTFLMFFLTFIPIGVFLWRFRIDQVSTMWSRLVGRKGDTVHMVHDKETTTHSEV
ncbi:MAG: CPBP family intramembrane metalloprotease [Candidatus Thorarchaeota archaeon]|nr:CPBP family intramembrane metalloprotease [Candidatus Thorarchaeota archaeon]